ncbi:hypothetical protein ACWFRQ_09125 [Streptomyces niveus]
MREGEEVRILRKDLAHLVPWMPSLEQTVADIPEDAPHWDFTVFQPRADGMVIAKLALSASCPAASARSSLSLWASPSVRNYSFRTSRSRPWTRSPDGSSCRI